MELRVLRYFLAVAREETISAAAELLHVSQPTLSRQLMELEESLGCKLFHRGSRKITLTEEGLLLKNRGQDILDLVGQTERDLRLEDGFVGGNVSIGGGETQAMEQITAIAQKAQQAHPAICYHLYSGNGDDVGEKLDKGLLDFGLLIAPVDITKYDFLPLPMKDTWGLLMRKDSPLATKTAITPHDLLGLPLIVSRQSLVADLFRQWAGLQTADLSIVATYNLIYNATFLVRQSMGCALTLEGLVNTAQESDLTFLPLAPNLEAKLTLVWKKHQVFSKAGKCFLQALEKEFS